MSRIKTIKDVINWRLCTGCGICSHICGHDVIEMRNIESLGIRPFILQKDKVKNDECLKACPGYSISAISSDNKETSLLIGPSLEVWEGFASNEEIRNSASSGGLLSALALYCIEKEGMSIVLHTGMDPEFPWKNKTIISRNKQDLIQNTGSRYTSSSPCDSIDKILQCPDKSVFIGKPCDVAAISMLRKQVPELDEKLGLVLSFFCAGTPSTSGVLNFLKQININKENVKFLKYRGNGWPGNFTIRKNDGSINDTKTYEESWKFLSRYRPIRCQLCPDGLGELSDITCGDAWHRLSDDNNKGLSFAVVRTNRGKDILKEAHAAGYINLEISDPAEVIKAQGLVNRRKELYGRLLAFKILLIPVTSYKGFRLFDVWKKNPLKVRIKTILGTYKRIFFRHYWIKKG